MISDYERIKREYDLSLLEKLAQTVRQLPTIEDLWPVGSIYLSLDPTDPATRFGGVWERIENAFLLAASTAHPAGESGGEEQHALTHAEMPRVSMRIPHVAGFNGAYGQTGCENTTVSNGDNYEGAATPLYGAYWHKIAFGGNGAHNNMPPYLSVYMWKRVK